MNEQKRRVSPLVYIALLLLTAVNVYLIYGHLGSSTEVLSAAGRNVSPGISLRADGMSEFCGDLYLMVDGAAPLEGSWRSTDESVAMCSGSDVVAQTAGTTRLIQVENDRYRYWTVTVSDYEAVIAPMGRKLQLNAGSECTGWSSSSSKIAAVDEAGKLTPKAVGECTVIASDAAGRQYGWKVSVKRTAYITIDDWPNENTDSILDTLKKYDIKATFFLVGQKNHIEKYQRIIDEGHAIGNHTRSHNFDVIYDSSDSLVRSVQLMDEWLMEKFNVSTKLFRFPGGYYGRTDEQRGAYRKLKDKGYRIYDWTCSVDDVKHDDADDIMRLFKKTLDEDVEVILMHNSKSAAALLEDVIKHLQANDYVCLPIDEETPTFDFVRKWQD